MKVVYVHHGERVRNGAGVQSDGLTELGTRDSEVVAELLAKKGEEGFRAIYTSSLPRCVETAKILNSVLDVDIIEDERLQEFGSLDGETWQEAQARLLACLDDIVLRYDNEDVVVCVTSGVNLGAFICKAFNLPPSESTPFLGVLGCSPIVFDFKKGG